MIDFPSPFAMREPSGLEVSPRRPSGGPFHFVSTADAEPPSAAAHDELPGDVGGHYPGYVPGSPDRAPQGAPLAEGKDSPFNHMTGSVTRELMAMLPPPSSQTTPHRMSTPVTPLQPKPSVQFSVQPGELPASPPVLPMHVRTSGGPPRTPQSQFSDLSPQRPPRNQSVAATFKRMQSRSGGTHHYSCIELPKDDNEVPLELTLQHSTRIEKVSVCELMPFKEGEQPFVHGHSPSSSTVKRIRGAPELNRNVYYCPSDLTDSAASGSREVVTGTFAKGYGIKPVSVQVFVLFPSLMRPPRWLRKGFSLNKRAAVEISWDISRRAQLFLHMMRRLEASRGQYLSVWASRRRYGPGDTFTLYGAEGTTQLTDRSYVVALKFFERCEGPAPSRNVAGSSEGAKSLRNSDPSVLGATMLGGTETLATTFSYGKQPTLKGQSRVEALQEVQHLVALRAQNSDLSMQFSVPEGGIVTWDTALGYALHMRDGPTIRMLIDSHYVDHLLKSQDIVDKVEKVAIAGNDAGLMLLLYEHTAIEMDLRVLAFIIHAWASQPSRKSGSSSAQPAGSMAVAEEDYDLPEGVDPNFNSAAAVEEFLVKYVVKRRNPLSTTAAILCAMEDEMSRHEENRRVMRLNYSRFHSFHLALLRRLNRYAEARNIRLIERIFQPADSPNTVNEVSPLQVAFDAVDLKFMSEVLIDVYVKVQWAGGELLALTAHEDQHTMGATNPLLAYTVLCNLGFAGKGTLDPLIMAACRTWHAYAFTSTALFNSPRGRWAVHALSELAFLTLYQWQVMYPRMETKQLRIVHLVFLCIILGNLLDVAQFIYFRYGSLARIRRFVADPWNALGLFVNSVLLVLTSLKVAQDYNAPGIPAFGSDDTIHMCMATLAVLVWVRALGMAVPVYPSLGPLLNTVARMIEEVVAFLFPFLIVMTGFSTMLSSIYQELVPAYANFSAAILQLFSSMLGNFDFTLFDGLTQTHRLYGIIVQVIFLVTSAILLMNLLIAIMNNRYRPEEVEAETQFKKAQIVTYYQTQVTRNLVCSPFCLPHLALRAMGMPCGSRQKISGSARHTTKMGLLPLDGVVLPDDVRDRPTGLGEVPHLVFLLTLYPVLIVVSWMLFLLYTPFGVWQFASKQYKRLIKGYKHRRKASKAAKLNQGAAMHAANRNGDSNVDKLGPPPIGASNGRESMPRNAGKLAVDNTEQFLKFKKALQQVHQQDMGFFTTVAFSAGTMLLTIAGVLWYVVLLLLVLMLWSSLYQWAAKVIFSLYNVLVRPFTDMWRSQRRRRRVAPAPQSAHVALAVQNTLIQNSNLARGSTDPAVSPSSQAATYGAFGFFGLRSSSHKHPGHPEGQGQQRQDAVGEDVLRKRRAQIHWRHAILRVMAVKNERYMTKRDILKAMAVSKFKPHMAGWNLVVDPRKNSQDIMDEQMEDLENDDDAWDDDEYTAVEDDDTMEAMILDRTESLAELVKSSTHKQQASLAAVQVQLEALANEVSRLIQASARVPSPAPSHHMELPGISNPWNHQYQHMPPAAAIHMQRAMGATQDLLVLRAPQHGQISSSNKAGLNATPTKPVLKHANHANRHLPADDHQADHALSTHVQQHHVVHPPTHQPAHPPPLNPLAGPEHQPILGNVGPGVEVASDSKQLLLTGPGSSTFARARSLTPLLAGSHTPAGHNKPEGNLALPSGTVRTFPASSAGSSASTPSMLSKAHVPPMVHAPTVDSSANPQIEHPAAGPTTVLLVSHMAGAGMTGPVLPVGSPGPTTTDASLPERTESAHVSGTELELAAEPPEHLSETQTGTQMGSSAKPLPSMEGQVVPVVPATSFGDRYAPVDSKEISPQGAQ